MSVAPTSKRSSQSLQEQVQLSNQIAWLTYVQNKAKTGEGENYARNTDRRQQRKKSC